MCSGLKNQQHLAWLALVWLTARQLTDKRRSSLRSRFDSVPKTTTTKPGPTGNKSEKESHSITAVITTTERQINARSYLQPAHIKRTTHLRHRAPGSSQSVTGFQGRTGSFVQSCRLFCFQDVASHQSDPFHMWGPLWSLWFPNLK